MARPELIQIKSPEDIDRQVEDLRVDYFGQILGENPILLYTNQLPRDLIDSLQSNNLASSLWKHNIRYYSGSTANFSTQITANFDAAISFIVQADLIRSDGKEDGKMERSYLFYILRHSLKPKNEIVKLARTYAEIVYGKAVAERLDINKALFMTSTLLDKQHLHEVISTSVREMGKPKLS